MQRAFDDSRFGALMQLALGYVLYLSLKIETPPVLPGDVNWLTS